MKKVGQVLAEYRLKQNISLEKIAQITRIRVEFLKAIEDNRFEELPAEPFVRGFLHSYANYLGLDPETILALLRRDFKTGEKGKIVPRQFLKQIKRQQTWVGPRLTVAISTTFVVILVLGYAALQWWKFRQPPPLVVSSPEQNENVQKNVTVRGKTSIDAVVTVDSKPTAITPDGMFETTVFFPDDGTYTITIQSADRHQRTSTIQRTVTVKE
ncbi:MAG: helix-turn-helix domain-containing protein [Patescibacteria group bacterium]